MRLSLIVTLAVLLPSVTLAGGLSVHDANGDWVGEFDTSDFVFVPTDGLIAQVLYKPDDTLWTVSNRVYFASIDCSGQAWMSPNGSVQVTNPRSGMAIATILSDGRTYVADVTGPDSFFAPNSYIDSGTDQCIPTSGSIVLIPAALSTWTPPPYPLHIELHPPVMTAAVSALGGVAVGALVAGLVVSSWGGRRSNMSGEA